MLNSVLFPVPGNTSTTSPPTARPRYGTTIWNNSKMEKTIKPSIFKAKDKRRIFDEYNEEI